MARVILTAVLVVLLNVVVGCNNIDSGRSQLMPARTRTSLGSAATVNIAEASETDIIEQVAINRQAYRQGLELLVEYYTKAGDNMRLVWAKRELAALNAMPQYKYIIGAGLAGPNLKASASIPEADDLYFDALVLEKKARNLIVVKDAGLLRLVLDKYNQLISKYPTSDKIDDAAFRAGGIYEHFKDYTIAVLYYKRAYQWDPDTTYPARFKAAYVLDIRLHRRAEALELYQQAVEVAKETGRHSKFKKYAENRIRKLTTAGEISE